MDGVTLAPTQPSAGLPANTLEMLRKFWADSLQMPVAKISDDTNFFAHGADSMDSIYLETRVEAWFAVPLPEFAVIEAPTPGEMAELLAECAAGNPPRRNTISGAGIIPVRAGEPGSPSLYICPLHTMECHWLARLLPQSWHIFELKRGPEPPIHTVEPAEWFHSVVRIWTEALLAEQPEGPWRLLTFCGRAPFAWETARLLGERGQTSLMLVDPYFPVPEPAKPPVEERVSPMYADVITSYSVPPANLDLTLMLTPTWVLRPHAVRYADFALRSAVILDLPPAPGKHSLSARSIGAITAEVRHRVETQP